MCYQCDCAAAIILAVAIKRKREKQKLKRCQSRKLRNINCENLKRLECTSDIEYKNNLRMDANSFEDLLSRISPYISKQNTVMGTSIKARHRLLVALRFLINGKSYSELRSEISISAQSIANIVMETCDAIIKTLNDCIKLPSSQQEWKKLAKGFGEKWNFPNCLGAIDARHIAIAKPGGSGSAYYNCHKFFSVVMMAVVNANHEFIMVDIGSAGGISSADLCNLFLAKLQNEMMNLPQPDYLPDCNVEKMPFVFVADKAFPLLDNVMKPFTPSPIKRNEIIFNYRLSRARRTATNVMGLLASRFRFLLTTVNLPPQKVATIALACCYLHNFLLQRKDKFYYSGGFDIENKETAEIRLADWHSEQGLTGLAADSSGDTNIKSIEMRNKYCKYFNTFGFIKLQNKALYKRIKLSHGTTMTFMK